MTMTTVDPIAIATGTPSAYSTRSTPSSSPLRTSSSLIDRPLPEFRFRPVCAEIGGDSFHCDSEVRDGVQYSQRDSDANAEVDVAGCDESDTPDGRRPGVDGRHGCRSEGDTEKSDDDEVAEDAERPPDGGVPVLDPLQHEPYRDVFPVSDGDGRSEVSRDDEQELCRRLRPMEEPQRRDVEPSDEDLHRGENDSESKKDSSCVQYSPIEEGVFSQIE